MVDAKGEPIAPRGPVTVTMTGGEQADATMRLLREEVAKLAAEPRHVTHNHYHGQQSLLGIVQPQRQPLHPQYYPPQATWQSDAPMARQGYGTVLASGDGETRFS